MLKVWYGSGGFKLDGTGWKIRDGTFFDDHKIVRIKVGIGKVEYG